MCPQSTRSRDEIDGKRILDLGAAMGLYMDKDKMLEKVMGFEQRDRMRHEEGENQKVDQ